MLRMRYVGVFLVALASVLAIVGIASAQGSVWVYYEMTAPLAFNDYYQLHAGTGMGWIDYTEDSGGFKGWSGHFNFQNLQANKTYTVKGSSASGLVTVCSFTANGFGQGGCWMTSPMPTWPNGGFTAISYTFNQTTGGWGVSCKWPSLYLYDSDGNEILRAYQVSGMNGTCVASQIPPR